jgi:hypothetical protein
MNKTAVEWLEQSLILSENAPAIDQWAFDKAKKKEKEQMIELLTKYHNRLFFIPMKEGEAERIYTHLIQDNE